MQLQIFCSANPGYLTSNIHYIKINHSLRNLKMASTGPWDAPSSCFIMCHVPCPSWPPLAFMTIMTFMTHGNAIFDILESHAFQKYSTLQHFKYFLFVICVFVYLCILHLIHGNVILDILESHAFQKYSTCWVLSLSLSLQNLKNLKKLKKWVAAAALRISIRP